MFYMCAERVNLTARNDLRMVYEATVGATPVAAAAQVTIPDHTPGLTLQHIAVPELVGHQALGAALPQQ